MNIRCPRCQTLYRVDPERVPAAGIRARCSSCGQEFPIPAPAASAPAHLTNDLPELPERGAAAEVPHTGPSAPPAPQPTREQAPPPATPARPAAPLPPTFGALDPHARAQRLARALISDIVAYYGERRDQSLRAGSLQADFREEILKSWEEYTQQVGEELAQATPYFRDALNQVLARGEKVF